MSHERAPRANWTGSVDPACPDSICYDATVSAGDIVVFRLMVHDVRGEYIDWYVRSIDRLKIGRGSQTVNSAKVAVEDAALALIDAARAELVGADNFAARDERLAVVARVLAENGCDCHKREWFDSVPCLACRIEAAMKEAGQ